MSYLFNNPGNPEGIPHNTGAQFAFLIKELLVSAGWVVNQSGTGAAYAASDLITSSLVMDVANAWFEVQDPAGGRAWTFQRTTNSASFRVKYAATGGFDVGDLNSTGAGLVAGEEQILFGGGTDAAPTGTSFGTASGAKYAYLVADDAAPYAWAAYSKDAGGATPRQLIFQDALEEDSYSLTDTDPVIIGTGQGWSTQAFFSGVNAKAWFRKASGSGAFQTCGCGSMSGWGGSSTLIPGGMGTDPESGDDIQVPLVWGRVPSLGAPAGWKGVSSLFKAMGAVRADGDTISETTSRDRICLNRAEWTMPWNGTTPLV